MPFKYGFSPSHTSHSMTQALMMEAIPCCWSGVLKQVSLALSSHPTALNPQPFGKDAPPLGLELDAT